MAPEEIADLLLDAVKSTGVFYSVGRIDGEPVIGVETEDGEDFFITVEAG